jgi:uncharacterized UBP type Zn finger protein
MITLRADPTWRWCGRSSHAHRTAARSAWRLGRLGVHLRLCLTCGHVGCCDSSPFKHAWKHANNTGHPIMRSLEPEENWRWCYAHRAYA